MRELRWLLLVFALCLPIVWLASGWKVPWADDRPAARPRPVPAGDQEVAWLHTTTAGATWERFVTGVVRAAADVPGLSVDDSRAFLPSTTDTPEVVLSRAGHAGKVHVRWYKLQNGVSTADWVKALGELEAGPARRHRRRQHRPRRATGRGHDRPADVAGATRRPCSSPPPPPTRPATAAQLTDVYHDRTFRFCFSNRQMAEAVIDFTFARPELLPRPPAGAAVPVITVSWADDPYSVDLQNQFVDALARKFPDAGRLAFLDKSSIPFSVGGYVSANRPELDLAHSVVALLRGRTEERVLLVLPNTTQPARRFLQAVVDVDPTAAGKLVAVTGDGIPLNAVLRDGEFAWPVGAVPVPLVFFAHNNPVAWNPPAAAPRPTADPFDKPNGTEEAMHFGELAKVLAEACFPPNKPTADRGDELTARLNARDDFFTAGERNANAGQHVVVVSPGLAPTLTAWRQRAKGQLGGGAEHPRPPGRRPRGPPVTDTETFRLPPPGERPAGWGRTVAKYALGLAPFVVVWVVLVGWLAALLSARADWADASDREQLREWLEEARPFRKTLPDVIREYVEVEETADGTRALFKKLELEEQLRGAGRADAGVREQAAPASRWATRSRWSAAGRRKRCSSATPRCRCRGSRCKRGCGRSPSPPSPTARTSRCGACT